jgi:DNA-binding transcriptional ArsR family regulator
MSEVLDMAAIAALVGDPARANILCALLDGRALTASELAYAAHITPQTASGHLGKLSAARLIVPAQQGRHRYFRLAGPHIAAMLESISAVAAIAPPRLRPIRIDDTMRTARMCYDHLAGRLGVMLSNSPTMAGWSRRRARCS